VVLKGGGGADGMFEELVGAVARFPRPLALVFVATDGVGPIDPPAAPDAATAASSATSGATVEVRLSMPLRGRAACGDVNPCARAAFVSPPLLLSRLAHVSVRLCDVHVSWMKRSGLMA
jgi:hypothetical protein